MSSVLILLAHNDDEFFLGPYLDHLKMNSSSVYITYLTHGSLYGASSECRKIESGNFLYNFSIGENNIFYIGEVLNIFDGKAIFSLNILFGELLNKYKNFNIDTVIIPAWEGGHHDHDSVHLIGVALSKRLNIKEVYEFSIYNGYKTRGPFFNVMRFVDFPESVYNVITFRFTQSIKYIFLSLIFRSQLKTFMGLMLGILKNFVFKRKLKLRKVPVFNYNNKPHIGKLFFERRFKFKFESFKFESSEFIKNFIAEQ